MTVGLSLWPEDDGGSPEGESLYGAFRPVRGGGDLRIASGLQWEQARVSRRERRSQMQRSFRLSALGIAAVLAALVGAVMALAAPAARGNSEQAVLSGSLAPSVPTDPAIFGVAPGGLPWVLAAGQVQLGAGGMLQANVARLIVPTLGSNPVPYIAASVYCGGALAATTAPVPFSGGGNAQIHANVSLPAFCPAPAVLLKPATGSSSSDIVDVYIAFDGMR